MKYKILLSFYCACLAVNLTNSQGFENSGDPNFQITTYTPNVIPGDVEASKFSTYGNVSANLAQGTPAIDIALHTLTDMGVEIPIRLQYDASGIKVNDHSGIVGLKWSLHTGGMIRRSINSRPDEENGAWLDIAPTVDLSTIPSSVSSHNSSYSDKNQNHVNLLFSVNGGADYKSDYYSINAPGLNGRFIFDENAQPLFLQRSNKNKVYFNKVTKTFEVTSNNGVKYFFGKQNDQSFYNSSTSSNSVVGYGGGSQRISDNGNSSGSGNTGITGFLTNQIRNSNGLSLFEFSYNDRHQYGSIDYKESYSYQTSEPIDPESGDCQFANEQWRSVSIQNHDDSLPSSIVGRKQTVQFNYENTSNTDATKRLKEVLISSSITGELIKVIQLNYEDYQGSNKFKLKQVLFKSSTGVVKNSYEFNYNLGVIPNAGSKAQDINGYYNGAINNDGYVDKDFFNTSNIPSHILTKPEINNDRKIDPILIQNGILQEIVYPTGGKTRFEYYLPTDIQGGQSLTDGVFLKYSYDVDDNNNQVQKKQYIFYKDFYVAAPSGEIDYRGSGLPNSCPNSYWISDDITDDDSRRKFNKVKVEILKENNVVERSEEYAFKWAFDNPYLIDSRKYSSDKELVSHSNYQLDILPGVKMFSSGSESEHGSTPKTYTVSVFADFYPNIFYHETNKISEEKFAGQPSIYNRTEQVFNDQYQIQKSTQVLDLDEKRITTYYYPYSPEVSLTTALKNKFISLNMLIPLEVRKGIEEDGVYTELDHILTDYLEFRPNQIKPQFINYDKSHLQLQEDLEKRVEFVDYDQYGNVLEYSQYDGASTCYVWGYNDTAPIVSITNSSYSGMPQDLLNLISSASTISNTEKSAAEENLLRSKLEQIRNHFYLENSMVTTFTYDPSIGVTSRTDPKGYTYYYEYDIFNRLQLIRDADENIVSFNGYNYKSK